LKLLALKKVRTHSSSCRTGASTAAAAATAAARQLQQIIRLGSYLSAGHYTLQ
jgi:hypothetical protein